MLSIYIRAKTDANKTNSIDDLIVMNYYLVKDGKAYLMFPSAYEGDAFNVLNDYWTNFRIDFQIDVDPDFKLDGSELFVCEFEKNANVYEMQMRGYENQPN